MDEKAGASFRVLLRYLEVLKVLPAFGRLPPTEYLITGSLCPGAMADSIRGLRRECKDGWSGKIKGATRML